MSATDTMRDLLEEYRTASRRDGADVWIAQIQASIAAEASRLMGHADTLEAENARLRTDLLAAKGATTPIEFVTGDADTAAGWPGSVMLDVAYIAEFPRGADSKCAFCHGDPCNENSPPDSHIARYFARNTRPETCPCCDGRPT